MAVLGADLIISLDLSHPPQQHLAIYLKT